MSFPYITKTCNIIAYNVAILHVAMQCYRYIVKDFFCKYYFSKKCCNNNNKNFMKNKVYASPASKTHHRLQMDVTELSSC